MKLQCPRKHNDGSPHDPKNIKREPNFDKEGKIHSYSIYCAEPTPEDYVFKKCMYHFPDEKK